MSHRSIPPAAALLTAAALLLTGCTADGGEDGAPGQGKPGADAVADTVAYDGWWTTGTDETADSLVVSEGKAVLTEGGNMCTGSVTPTTTGGTVALVCLTNGDTRAGLAVASGTGLTVTWDSGETTAFTALPGFSAEELSELGDLDLTELESLDGLQDLTRN